MKSYASAREAWRPPVRVVLGSPIHLLAFGFGAGLAPVAPGTFGTLVGVPFWLALSPLPPAAFIASVVALFVFGCWVCGASAQRLGVHDYGGIVFDEIVGFLVTCLPLLPWFTLPRAPAWLALTIAFAAFRVFDVLKPWPIGWLDRRVHGGFGIMLDDLLAGLYAAFVLAAVLHFGGTEQWW
jgi:phosphatidylglycerophosphatase A